MKPASARWTLCLALASCLLASRAHSQCGELLSNTAIDGAFHHVAATYDGSAMRIYVDGSPSGSGPLAGFMNSFAGGKLVLGNATAYNNPFDGLIDEVRLWNYARTQAEIQASMNVEIGTAPGLVGYWRMNGDGTDLAAGNTMVPQAGASFATGHLGQAANIPTGGYFQVPALASYSVAGGFTLECWVQVRSSPGPDPRIMRCIGPVEGGCPAPGVECWEMYVCGSSCSSGTLGFSLQHNLPAPQCSDGLDNDGDGCADYPCDLGCTSASDVSESEAGCSLVAGCPIYWPTNGHYYELIPSPTSWTNACQSASGRVHEGLRGHLVTFNSIAEMTFVSANVVPASSPGLWTGAFQPPGSPEPAASWQWISGESVDPSMWCAGEPLGVGCGGAAQEDVAEFIKDSGCLNDLSWCLCRGYIVEYESAIFACPTIEEGGCPLTCDGVATCHPPPPPPACSDGIDNDGDGCADYPNDLGCTSASDNSETGGGCRTHAVPTWSPWSLAMAIILIAGMATPTLWRRRKPSSRV